jgi:hypothetical protein
MLVAKIDSVDLQTPIERRSPAEHSEAKSASTDTWLLAPASNQ